MQPGKKTAIKALLLILVVALALATTVAVVLLSSEQLPLPSADKSPVKADNLATVITQSLAGQSSAQAVQAKPILVAQRTLRRGMRGTDVSQLQARLTSLGYSPGPVDGYFGMQTYYAVVAFQKVNGLSRDGVAGPKTLAALARPVSIGARFGGSHIEINKARQVLLVVKNGKVVKIITTSTGRRGYTTPSGTFRVYYKPGYRYYSRAYGGWMIWSSFFYRGIAVHGYSSVPPYPASHGCVRVPIPDSKYVYNNMPIGSFVYVY